MPAALPGEENRVFRSTVIEVDRNFASNQDQIQDHGPGLIVHKHALERMAGLAFQNKTLSLGDLYTLVTDLDMGMGMRLTYGVPMPPPAPGQEPGNTPPPMMFQSADRYGVAVGVFAREERIHQIWESGGLLSEEQRAAQEAAVRAAIQEALAATQAPSMEQLFGGLVTGYEFITIEKLSARIRNARSHIPFNWSGRPNCTFWPTATGGGMKTHNRSQSMSCSIGKAGSPKSPTTQAGAASTT